MSENNKLIERKPTELIKEKSQYAIAFGVIAMMLYITGFPVFVIFFFGILAFFIWKTLSTPSPNGTRQIFEFYLMANDILRDDERRWYGFEINEVLARGERILKYMKAAPPLVHFTVGALYNKIGDHQSAEKHLAYVVENESADEKAFVYPSPELRDYVKTLRKIEREPAEAPLMSSAVRALERARRNRAKSLLETTRDQLREAQFNRTAAELDRQQEQKQIADHHHAKPFVSIVSEAVQQEVERQVQNQAAAAAQPPPPPATDGFQKKEKRKKEKTAEDAFHNRKPITEVLRDIYDAK
ncbi:MAG: hypothetical protein JSS81_19285 [Acidobacteria bacterium]|nr:hypothetical protein [Acidobacteriota bacterium]